MALLRVFLLISIIVPVIIKANNRKYYNGRPVTVGCPRNQLIYIKRTEFKVQDTLTRAQETIFKNLKDMKQEVKEKCQYKHRCVIDLDIRIRDKIYLNIDFYCEHEGCPSWMFIEKHMARFKNDPTDAQLETAASDFETKRVKHGWQLTDVIDFYADPIEFMEYRRYRDTCTFKTAAKKYHCVKPKNNWNCQRSGEAKATHNITTGHLIGEAD